MGEVRLTRFRAGFPNNNTKKQNHISRKWMFDLIKLRLAYGENPKIIDILNVLYNMSRISNILDRRLKTPNSK